MHKQVSALDVLRARCACSCSPATTSYAIPLRHHQQPPHRHQRGMHATAFADPNPDPDRTPHPSARRAQRAQRTQRPSASYRFPTKGRRGGAPDPYEVLGLERGASGAEIKSAYYGLALLLHPDSSHPSASAEHFALLNKAYKLLSTSADRNSYLQTGYGWSGGFDTQYSEDSRDAAAREIIRRARAAGASEWRSRGFRDSEAGSGAWTYRNVDGQQWHPYDADGHATGGGEELFMSNTRFVAIILAFGGAFAFFQYLRFGGVKDNTRDHLIDRHIHASKALEEARREAAMFGKERREQLRRRVRELHVMEEIEKLERGGGIRHTRAVPPPENLSAGPGA